MTKSSDEAQQKLNDRQFAEIIRRLEEMKIEVADWRTSLDNKLDRLEERVQSDEKDITRLQEKLTMSQTLQASLTVVLSGVAALSNLIFRR